MRTPARIGLLGGTFDPVHMGHLAAAGVALEALHLDEVLLLTSHVPPHRPQPAAPLHHRFAMVALAVQDRPALLASDLELAASGPSYTADTLRRLHEQGYDPAQLFFITGADAFAEIETWRGYPQVLDAAHFVVVDRAGLPARSLLQRLDALAPRMAVAEAAAGDPVAAAARTRIFLVDSPTPDVSSTMVRARCADGRSITGLVAPAVERHIRRHGLYTAGRPGTVATPPHHGAASLLHEQEQP